MRRAELPKVSRYLLGWILILAACTRSPLKDPANAYRLAHRQPELQDSYPIESLKDAIKKTLATNEAGADYKFGDRVVSRSAYRAALTDLLQHADSVDQFNEYAKTHFDFFEVYGSKNWGDVFVTGYYAPLIKGSRKPTVEHSRAL